MMNKIEVRKKSWISLSSAVAITVLCLVSRAEVSFGWYKLRRVGYNYLEPGGKGGRKSIYLLDDLVPDKIKVHILCVCILYTCNASISPLLAPLPLTEFLADSSKPACSLSILTRDEIVSDTPRIVLP